MRKQRFTEARQSGQTKPQNKLNSFPKEAVIIKTVLSHYNGQYITLTFVFIFDNFFK